MGFDPHGRFVQIYEHAYRPILGYVLRRCQDPDDAADVVAETFAIAWRRIDEIPPGDEARLWLYGVARRTLANKHRDETRRTALAVRLRAELTVWSENVVEDDPDGIRQAFMRLRPDDRELLSLISWEGLSCEEIAKVLGCSHGAVRLRLHRARKRLARELDSAGLDMARYGSRAVALAKGQL
jgi:RNA polymerase sigma factor (sigma-70 family)